MLWWSGDGVGGVGVMLMEIKVVDVRGVRHLYGFLKRMY